MVRSTSTEKYVIVVVVRCYVMLCSCPATYSIVFFIAFVRFKRRSCMTGGGQMSEATGSEEQHQDGEPG